jgi:hypothetical protein
MTREKQGNAGASASSDVHNGSPSMAKVLAIIFGLLQLGWLMWLAWIAWKVLSQ